MTKQKKILVLFEDGVVREEPIAYAMELAKRLELPVEYLMLISNDSNVSGAEDAIKKKLTAATRHVQPEADSEIRCGDKATELLKFLASNSKPETIIWGGDRQKVGKLGTGRPAHWLNRLSTRLPCSVVSPIPKTRHKV